MSEYLLERMVIGGAEKICFVISPDKTDILEYFGPQFGPARMAYVVQPRPSGLCDAIFRADVLIGPEEVVVIGLPDTVWFPEDALSQLPDDRLSFLLFPVQRPQLFDAVVLEADGRVREIQVKRPDATSSWIWGAFKMPAAAFHELRRLWLERESRDQYIGTLVNAYLAAGGAALGIRAGTAYADVGTLHGYRDALQMLARMNTERGEMPSPRAFASEAKTADRATSG